MIGTTRPKTEPDGPSKSSLREGGEPPLALVFFKALQAGKLPKINQGGKFVSDPLGLNRVQFRRDTAHILARLSHFDRRWMFVQERHRQAAARRMDLFHARRERNPRRW
jgi:hypothetical protein